MQTTAPEETAPRRYPTLRWYICALLFYACTINYVDRQVMSLLKKPVFMDRLGWSNDDFGTVTWAFLIAYAIMMPIGGRIIDRIGAKRGYTIAVAVWSVAAVCHSFCRSVWQFAIARFCLGIGESANFPAAIRTVATWFPQRERAFATGIFNSGTNVGVIVASIAVPFIAAKFGWRMSFLFTTGLVVLWLILWTTGYRRPPGPEVTGEIVVQERIPYKKLVKSRGAWAFLTGKLMTDPVWWFYLFWIPGFLQERFPSEKGSLDPVSIGAPLIVIYLAADVGSIAGGWFSSTLLKRGWPVNAARKAAMLTCAILVTSVMFVPLTGNLWLTVALIGIAAGAHQGWSANLFTLVSDLFPQKAVGSVVGFGGFGGAVTGAFVSKVTGLWLDFSHNFYTPLFIVAGSMYLIAFVIIHLLVPKLERQNL